MFRKGHTGLRLISTVVYSSSALELRFAIICFSTNSSEVQAPIQTINVWSRKLFMNNSSQVDYYAKLRTQDKTLGMLMCGVRHRNCFPDMKIARIRTNRGVTFFQWSSSQPSQPGMQ
jgi:hypothetical protein